MPKMPIELPPKVATAFLADLRAFHSEPNAIKRDAIAARQAWLLDQHLKPSNKELQTNDVPTLKIPKPALVRLNTHHRIGDCTTAFGPPIGARPQVGVSALVLPLGAACVR